MERLSLPANLDSLQPLRDYLELMAREAGVDETTCYRLCLSVDEIATNAIVHGYHKAGREGMLYLEIDTVDNAVIVTLEDSGQPYDPRAAAPPENLDAPLEERRIGGIGCYLAINGVDEFDYQYVDGKNRNTFVVYRPQPPAIGSILLIGEVQSEPGRMSHYIKQLGYNVIEVDDCHDGIAALATEDVLLIAISSHVQAIHCMAELMHLKVDPRYTHVPVLLIAEDATPQHIAECLAAGVDDYIIMPVHPALLKTRIDSCLAKRWLVDQEPQDFQRMLQLVNDLQYVILPLGMALSQETDFERLLERIVMEVQSVCDADGTTLYLRDNDHLDFKIVINRTLNLRLGGTTGGPITFEPLHLHIDGEPNYHNMATCVALTGQTINIPDIYHTTRFDFTETKKFDRRTGYRTISCLTIPLKQGGNIIGVLQVINAQHPVTGAVIAFDMYHQLIVETLAALSSIALNVQNLLKQRETLLHLEHDLQISQQIQHDFLPEHIPVIPGWQIAAAFHPAYEVSGDFYDAFTVTGDLVALVVADVCDKGIGPALFMALLRSLLRAFTQQTYSAYWTDYRLDDDPMAREDESLRSGTALISTVAIRNAISLTNRYVVENHSQLAMFATLFFAVLDPETGTIWYVNAGHEPPVVLSRGHIKRRLEPTAMAVGIAPDMEFQIGTLRLEPGDYLVTFTDGVSEGRSPDGSFFTEARLLHLLEKTAPAQSAEALVNAIEGSLQTHIGTATQYDDITLLVLRRES